MSTAGPPLPPLRLEDWEPTKETLHRWLQIVGKIRLACSPPQNHWWHVTFAVTPEGLTTGRMRDGATGFAIDLDLLRHRLVLRTDHGDTESLALEDGLSVAAFHDELLGLLARLGLHPAIRPEPFGLPTTTPFSSDTSHASYDAAAVGRFLRVLAEADWALREFAGWFAGKSSPVQLFWHSFDLALARYSGRRAPVAADADGVTREAYSHEVIAFGFWPGDPTTRMPAFYSYTAPEPPELTDEPLRPDAAGWTAAGSGSLAVLPYEAVRDAPAPRETLLDFFQSAYEAGARRSGWDIAGLASSWAPELARGR